MTLQPKVAVFGSGPAALMAAEAAAGGGAMVTVYERMASPARKLLLAGRGGLNLTHSEPPAAFQTRYGARAPELEAFLSAFDASALRAWCEGLGIGTFVGTSGRVFPRGLKTSPLLRVWLRRLDAAGVRFAFRHAWVGWDAGGRPVVARGGERVAVEADAVVLALGGASWPHLGSDGAWTTILAEAGAEIAPLRPANCGFEVVWSDVFRDRFEGAPLQNIALDFEGRRMRGDVILTRTGLEGGAVYALSGDLREAIAAAGPATVAIALRPDLDTAALTARLARRMPKQSLSTALRKALGLAPQAIGLLRETTPDLVHLDDVALAERINAVPVRLVAPRPIARAISSAGGLAFSSLDAGLMLRARPGTFVAGEMLDWEAPTGGYLLQACFATGRAAGLAALAWAREQAGPRANDGADGAARAVL